MANQTVKREAAKTTGSKAEEYDLLILGSGTAGKLTAWTLAKNGMKTAAVERKYVGGPRANIVCRPKLIRT